MATMSDVPYVPWNEMSSGSWHLTESFLKGHFRTQKGDSKYQKRGFFGSIIVLKLLVIVVRPQSAFL